MERWVEYYFDFYLRQNVVILLVFDVIKCLFVMEEFDNEFINDEFSKVINSLVLRKVLGSDGIFFDLIKYCKIILLQFLYNVLCVCWKEGVVL